MDLKKVRVQMIDPATGEIQEDVDVATRADAVDYKDDVPLVSSIGGWNAGDVPGDTDIKYVVNKILHPYVKPTIALSCAPNGAILELGSSVASIAMIAAVTKKSENIKKVEFLKNSAVINTIAAPKPNGGSETYTNSVATNSDSSFKARVTDIKDGVVESNTISYTFVNPLYIGSLDAAAAIPTETQIKTLEKRIVNKSQQTFTYTVDNKRMVIACPPGWTLSKILDPNGFDVTASFKEHTVQVTCLNAVKSAFTVYVSEPTTQSSFAMTFKN